MRNLLLLLLVTAWIGSGCIHKPQPVFKPVPGYIDSAQVTPPPPPPPPRKSKPAEITPSKPLVTPDAVLNGRIVAYNDPGRFVVISFPVGHMPAVNQTMFVYRQDLKVGELKISGPQAKENIVADVVSGEARAGDEVRNR